MVIVNRIVYSMVYRIVYNISILCIQYALIMTLLIQTVIPIIKCDGCES